MECKEPLLVNRAFRKQGSHQIGDFEAEEHCFSLELRAIWEFGGFPHDISGPYTS